MNETHTDEYGFTWAKGKRFSGWFWLSFADAGFLGVVIVEARSIEAAAQRAWDLGINPGGQVFGVPLEAKQVPDPALRNRLLSETEIATIAPE